jgi:hypothetical protein
MLESASAWLIRNFELVELPRLRYRLKSFIPTASVARRAIMAMDPELHSFRIMGPARIRVSKPFGPAGDDF